MADTLRPADWSQYVGQQALKDELSTRITAASRERRPLDPILLTGPPGAGKTSLATVIAERMNEELEVLIMPVTARTLLGLVKSFEGCLLLDELHGLSPKAQESLQPLLEFNYMMDGSGRKHHCGRLSIIGATTNPQKIIEPLWDRFAHPTFDAYSDDEMCRIVIRMADKAGMVGLPLDDAMAFGRAAMGTPRRARQFVLAYKDLYLEHDYSPTVDQVMAMLRTERDGLTVEHMRYLETLEALGGTRGLKIIANLMRLNEAVVTDLERVLVMKGFVNYGDKGRELSREGFARLRQYRDSGPQKEAAAA